MKTQTTLINLYGSSGSGKSTVAAMLFAFMKCARFDVELIREAVKELTFTDKTLLPIDFFIANAEQIRLTDLYLGQVDFLITDSPLLLDKYYRMNNTARANMSITYTPQSKVCLEKNYFIPLVGKEHFQEKGRFEKFEESQKNMETLKTFLQNEQTPYKLLEVQNTNTLITRCRDLCSQILVDLNLSLVSTEVS